MVESLNKMMFPKTIDLLNGGFAFCDLILDKTGDPIDYRYIYVNDEFSKISNRKIESTIGKTFSEIATVGEQPWLAKIGAALLNNKPSNFSYLNPISKQVYSVNAFVQSENKFVLLINAASIDKTAPLERTRLERENRKAELRQVKKKLRFQKKEKENRTVDVAIEKNKIKRNDWSKTDFLAKMSGEIRSPMHGILGLCELLAKPNIPNELQHDYIAIIDKLGSCMLAELEKLSNMLNPVIMKFEKVIHESVYKNLTVSELAFHCDMSLSSFKRKFTELYEVTPSKYFLSIKLDRASELLKNKNNQISTIAYDSGFESLATFNRSFKAYYGMSPSKYRLNATD